MEIAPKQTKSHPNIFAVNETVNFNVLLVKYKMILIET